MKGDVRTDPASSSLTLYTSDASRGGDESMEFRREKIRPYTRKWETDLMQTINELELTVKPNSDIDQHRCDVRHDVPAVFFSTGGYTGNLYHEFNDGILPLYITSQQMNRKVVFVILEYHNWWMTKYGDVISQLTDFPVIDFYADQRTHCFPEAIVGLKIHGELTIDPTQMQSQKTILDFHDLLGQAYAPRIRSLIEEEKLETEQDPNKPKLVIISRNGSRAITNQDALVKMANEIGFKVEVLSPKRSMELAKIYHILNSSDVVIGVHGAAMTHLIFMKRRAVFIQVIPLGTDWAADSYYGEPARKFGLRYIPYKILPRESSLYRKYHRDDPVLVDPTSVNSKGWEFTKRIYLSHQNVRLNLPRFRKHLLRAYAYCHQIKE